MMTLQQALAWIPGGRLVGDGAVPVLRVHTDTRTLQPGDLFVALQGERFDAHDFLAEAKARGAVAAIAQRGLAGAGLPGIEVADSKRALGALAAGWRAQFSLPLLAVTGSNGKTTVTQMIAAILRNWKGAAAFATQGNLNNDIGVPLTLLRLRAVHAVAVVELGMNHPGEIASLAAMARPTVALVNNAQREHLEFMATVEAVARENGAVIESLAPQGVAVFPADDAYTPIWTALAGSRACMSFGTAAGADISLAGIEWKQGHWQVGVQTPAGPLAYELHIAGRHNVRNSLAAVACTLAAGVPLAAIAQGLGGFEPVKGRSRALGVTLAGRPLTLVDDTYNANPDSVRAAIEVLAELPGPRLLVLGDMGEVGDQGPQFHAEVGAHAKALGIETLFTLGTQSARAADSFGAGRHFDGIEALNAAVLAELAHTASVLVKGSRFMKMERVVEAITAQAQQPQQQDKEEGHAA
ncbi:UDP-N-acetylmuramoyl-tripeptide--D-alanyl-D-alanine ligase [Variovorax terrae]|uniref:UDP-N-acetylmuramoyl-tripeptide--D-alanyl-D-alanine ligase n=1 Tax=Variovorax terrae TaxID=2923278 RepID=A0A9X2AKW1_9BURK|nr:UDP-N-acetylmuramoyl-tripeptide--D-alanyl-D-alanine ligase [Variovorax terrae]MCJ0761973.1 UDP-N-acetylmuramoyl-tripeptide--D-alanyl-D-alanine ligase [Variovorax terrae]